MKNKFPNGFFWGTATASYQIEGATDKDGKSKVFGILLHIHLEKLKIMKTEILL